MQGKSALGIVKKYYPQVGKVVDAKRGVSVLVTKDDCKYSTPRKPNMCAMAMAAKRSFDGAIISLSTAYLIKGRKATRFKVPNSVTRELVSFDRNKNFSPGIYDLNAPTEWTKLGPDRRKSRTDDRSHKSKGRMKHYHHTAGIRSL